jgi:hypothetical protein
MATESHLAGGAENVRALVSGKKSGNVLAPDTSRLMTLTSLLSTDVTEVRNTSSAGCSNAIDVVHRPLGDVRRAVDAAGISGVQTVVGFKSNTKRAYSKSELRG